MGETRDYRHLVQNAPVRRHIAILKIPLTAPPWLFASISEQLPEDTIFLPEYTTERDESVIYFFSSPDFSAPVEGHPRYIVVKDHQRLGPGRYAVQLEVPITLGD